MRPKKCARKNASEKNAPEKNAPKNILPQKNLHEKKMFPKNLKNHLGKSGPVEPHCLQPKAAALCSSLKKAARRAAIVLV